MKRHINKESIKNAISTAFSYAMKQKQCFKSSHDVVAFFNEVLSEHDLLIEDLPQDCAKQFELVRNKAIRFLGFLQPTLA
jgi:hypothetical protein